MSTRKTRALSGHTIARIGSVVGLGASIAANVAHACLRPGSLPPGEHWSPEIGAMVSGTLWPIALLLSTEIMMRKAWPKGREYLALRILGLAPVAVVAAVISYGHVRGLLLHYGETTLSASLGPLAIDGLMLVSTAALMAPDRVMRARRATRKPVRKSVQVVRLSHNAA